MLVRRGAGPSDIPALIDLCAGLFAEGGGPRDVAIDLGWPRREGRTYFSRVIGDGETLAIVAEVDSAAAGYLVGRMREPGETRPIRVAVLEAMYVQPGHRRRGIGAALVSEFRAWAGQQKASRLSVTAYVANVEAIRFYERDVWCSKSPIRRRQFV